MQETDGGLADAGAAACDDHVLALQPAIVFFREGGDGRHFDRVLSDGGGRVGRGGGYMACLRQQICVVVSASGKLHSASSAGYHPAPTTLSGINCAVGLSL